MQPKWLFCRMAYFTCQCRKFVMNICLISLQNKCLIVDFDFCCRLIAGIGNFLQLHQKGGAENGGLLLGRNVTILVLFSLAGLFLIFTLVSSLLTRLSQWFIFLLRFHYHVSLSTYPLLLFFSSFLFLLSVTQSPL